MTDPYLIVESEGGTLQSNEIASTGVGVEVKAGMTGLGLPPVTLQFSEGAGDGAEYRGIRVGQRVIDVRFQFYGPDRDSLKDHLDRVSRVVAKPCTITWVDEDAEESWQITGYRSGGGDYATGVDSDGTTHLVLDITFTTDDPYWLATNAEFRSVGSGPLRSSPTNEADLLTDHIGSAEAICVWRVTGPTLGFELTSPTGERFTYVSYVPVGETITVDMDEGTVTDSLGFNRYNEITASSRFFMLPNDTSEIHVKIDQISEEAEDVAIEARTNFITNPAFEVGIAGWSDPGSGLSSPTVGVDYLAWDATNKRLKTNYVVRSPSLAPSYTTSMELTGLTPGKTYQFSCDYFCESWDLYRGTVWIYDHGTSTEILEIPLVATSPTVQTISGTFVATASTVDVYIQPPDIHTGYYPGGTEYPASAPCWFDRIFVGEAGAYFDGATTDTDSFTYAWTSTANASTSTATFTPPVDPEETEEQKDQVNVQVEYRARKWTVI